MSRDLFKTMDDQVRQHVWCNLCEMLVAIAEPPFLEEQGWDLCEPCSRGHWRRKSYQQRVKEAASRTLGFGDKWI